MFTSILIYKTELGLDLKSLSIAAISIVVALVLIKVIIDYLEQRKVNRILKNYKSDKDDSSEKDTSKKNLKKAIPFKKRKGKQGLTWGGGNVKGSVPTRGDKKEFLK